MDIKGLVSLFLPREIEEKSFYGESGYSVMVDGGAWLPALSSYNLNLVIQNYESIAPLNTAIDKIAKAIAGLPIILVNKSSNKTVLKHPILDLLDHPNDEEQKTRAELFRDITIWKFLDGNVYLNFANISAINKQLQVLKPQFITIQADVTGYPWTYRYNTGNIALNFTKNPAKNRFITPDNKNDLLQIRNFNPKFSNGNLRGTSDIVPIFYEVAQYLEGSNHNLKLIMNGARPSGALVSTASATAQGLTQEQYDRLKDELRDAYSGSNNAGKPMLLEGGLDWKEMGLSPKDMDFVMLRSAAEQQIYKNLGVPIQLIVETGATYNNMASANLDFYKGTVIPTMNDFLNYLNNWLVPLFPGSDNLVLKIDMKNVDALRLEYDTINTTINNDVSLTINEKRAIRGLDSIEGGDKIVTAMGVAIAGKDAPLGTVQAQPIDVTPGQEDDAKKKLSHILSQATVISLNMI